MKKHTALLFPAMLWIVGSIAHGGEFHSVIITDTSSPLTINIADEQFLNIHNFTQENGSKRGVVTVTANGQTKDVLTATMISPGTVAPEFIKSIRIAGPATVTVNPVTGATLFITYRKRVEPFDVATSTVTPTATPTPTATAAAAITEIAALNSEVAESPTPTSTPADRPSPTPTPRSTPSPTPTATPQPTATPTPSLTPG
jgi:hypothetical protein